MPLIIRGNVSQSSGRLDWVPDGNAASPGITFSVDPDTGVFRPGPNQVGFTTGGTERLRVDVNGATVTGNVVAAGFVGDGSRLSNLQVANVVGLSDALQTIEANSVTANFIEATQTLTVGGDAGVTGNVVAAGFVGDGYGLTNLQVANVVGLSDALQTIDANSVTANFIEATQTLTVGGDAGVTGNVVASGNVTADSFSGSGASLTALNGSQITSGTVGTARLPVSSTSAQGIVQLSSATNSTSTTLAATASSVKSAYDLASSKLNSSGGTITGALSVTGNVTANTITANAFVGDGSGLTGIKLPPTVNTIQITDSSYTSIDDLALSTTSTGYFVIDGGNFETGTTVSVGGTAAASVSLVNTTQLRVSVDPKATGTYDVVVQTGGGSTTKINAISFDPVPVWSTAASLGDVYYSNAFSITLSATDAATYTATSSLPPSTTLASNGVLQGNITGTSPATYNFSVKATDAQLQDAIRSFSLVYNYFTASGGTVTTSGGYTYRRFTSNGTLTVSSGGIIEYLVVGGGGGGGDAPGGGGGAGQVIQGSVLLSTGSYPIVIGTGGTGGTGQAYVGNGNDGTSTTFNGLTAIGGGGGGNYYVPPGRNGGSGGGGGGYGGVGGTGLAGYNGGNGASSSGGGGGGGGAGGVGGTATTNNGGNGGAGVIWGPYSVGGGGGGAALNSSSAGGSATHGGGAGGKAHSVDGYNATANTGGGGGGGGGNNTTDGYGGGQGGSGVVIIRYIA